MKRSPMLAVAPSLALLVLANCDSRSPPVAPGTSSTARLQELAPAYAVLAPKPVSTDLPILAGGAGPDWSIRVKTGGIEVHSNDGSVMIFPTVVAVRTASGAKFSIGSGANAAELGLSAGPCRLFNSPITYPMNATASIRGRTLAGCAGSSPTLASAQFLESDWTDNLFHFAPAMRACLARTQTDHALASAVVSSGAGMISMQIRDADAVRFDCLAPAHGLSVAKFVAAGPAQGTGDSAAAFASSAAAFASLGCEETPAIVVSVGGAVLGYLQRGTCAGLQSATTAADSSSN